MEKENTKIEVKKKDKDNVLEDFSSAFFATEAGFNFDGRYVTIDFKNSSQRSSDVHVVEHRPIMLDIFHAKNFAARFNQFIAGLEKNFGIIEVPEIMKNIQKQANEAVKKHIKEVKTASSLSNNKDKDYLG